MERAVTNLMKQNYKYNEETGKIEIEVENKEESGKLPGTKKQ